MEKEATIEILKNITSKFEGYKNSKINDGKIIKIFDENFNNLKKTGTNDNYFVCFDKTPFFSGGGGQVPDSGKIFDLNNNLLALVVDGFKIAYNQMYYKIQLVDNNVISVNDNVIQNIDEDKRNKASQNHTALHLFADVLLTESNNVLVEKSANLNEDYFVIRYIYNEMFTDEFLKKSLAKAQSYLKEDHNQKEVWLSFEEALEKNLVEEKFEKALTKDDSLLRHVSFENITSALCSGTHVNNLNEISGLEIYEQYKSKKEFVIRATTNMVFYKKHIDEKITDYNNFLEETTLLTKEDKKMFNLEKNVNYSYATLKKIEENKKSVEQKVKEIKLILKKENEDKFFNKEYSGISLSKNIIFYEDDLDIDNKNVSKKLIMMSENDSNLYQIFVNTKTNSIIVNNKNKEINIGKVFKERKVDYITGGGSPFQLQLKYYDYQTDVPKFKKFIVELLGDK